MERRDGVTVQRERVGQINQGGTLERPAAKVAEEGDSFAPAPDGAGDVASLPDDEITEFRSRPSTTAERPRPRPIGIAALMPRGRPADAVRRGRSLTWMTTF